MEMTLARDDLVSIVAIANIAGRMEAAEVINIDCDDYLFDAAKEILCGFYNTRSPKDFFGYTYDELCRRFS